MKNIDFQNRIVWKSLITCLHCLLFNNASAQVSLNWAQNLYPTPIYSYTGRSMVIDNDGSIYTCGAFAGTADMDPGSSVYNLTSSGYSDIYIRKQNAAGNLIWAKRIGGSQNDLPSAICIDEHHRIYITGSFTNLVDFDPNSGVANLNTGSVANADIFALKLDSGGNYMWSFGMGSTSFHDQGTCIASDQHGRILLTGYFRQTVDFDPGPNLYNLTSNGNPNIFVLSLDTAKNFQWAYANLISGFYNVPMITTNALQEIFIGGSFTGTYDFDPGINSVVLTSAGNDDIFVQKLNSSGQLLWAKSIGGTGRDRLSEIRIDNTGDLHIGGSFQNSMDVDPSSSSTLLTSNGNVDVFALRWDGNANLQDAFSFGGSSEDAANGLYIDTAKNRYLTGYFMGTMDMDGGANTVNVSSNGLTDAFVTKYNSNGDFVWGRTFGAHDFDYGYTISGNDSGHIFGISVYRGNADLDPSTSIFTPDTNLSTCLFKWNQCFVDTQVNLVGSTLTASMSGADYQWLNCLGTSFTAIPGATNQNFTPSVGGEYALRIAQGDCVDTGSCFKIAPVGIPSLSLSNEIYIYPNPTHHEVEVHGMQEGLVQIRELAGRVCYTKKFTSKPIKFSVHDLPNGIYFVSLQAKDQFVIMKLIKE